MTPQECVVKLIEELAETLKIHIISYPIFNNFNEIVLWGKSSDEYNIYIEIFIDHINITARAHGPVKPKNPSLCSGSRSGLEIEFSDPDLIKIIEKIVASHIMIDQLNQ